MIEDIQLWEYVFALSVLAVWYLFKH